MSAPASGQAASPARATGPPEGMHRPQAPRGQRQGGWEAAGRAAPRKGAARHPAHPDTVALDPASLPCPPHLPKMLTLDCPKVFGRSCFPESSLWRGWTATKDTPRLQRERRHSGLRPAQGISRQPALLGPPSYPGPHPTHRRLGTSAEPDSQTWQLRHRPLPATRPWRTPGPRMQASGLLPQAAPSLPKPRGQPAAPTECSGGTTGPALTAFSDNFNWNWCAWTVPACLQMAQAHRLLLLQHVPAQGGAAASYWPHTRTPGPLAEDRHLPHSLQTEPRTAPAALGRPGSRQGAQSGPWADGGRRAQCPRSRPPHASTCPGSPTHSSTTIGRRRWSPGPGRRGPRDTHGRGGPSRGALTFPRTEVLVDEAQPRFPVGFSGAGLRGQQPSEAGVGRAAASKRAPTETGCATQGTAASAFKLGPLGTMRQCSRHQTARPFTSHI